MPYIKREDRGQFRAGLKSTAGKDLHPGELNYIITKHVHQFLGTNPNYEKFNAAIGVLEAAKLELYRRMVAPYEEVKIKENGDV